jgi:thiol-disulfide isomerase/thioredoxin
MRNLRWLLCLAVVLAPWCQTTLPAQKGEPADKVELKVLDYDGLSKLILDNKGKVVMLDFWFYTCAPCKEAFWNLGEFHKKYGDKGLVVISVNTDVDEDTHKAPDYVLKYLRDQKATFINVALDASAEVKKDKLRLLSYPCVYVFNQEGQWVQLRGDDLKRDEKTHHYYQIEAYIKELLAKQK